MGGGQRYALPWKSYGGYLHVKLTACSSVAKSHCLHLREPSVRRELDVILRSNRTPENPKGYSTSSLSSNHGKGQLLGISGHKNA